MSFQIKHSLWQTITLSNPVVYLISGSQWSFYGIADIGLPVSLVVICGFLAACLMPVERIFRTGYQIKQ